MSPIATVERLAALGPDDVVRWRDGLGATLMRTESQVRIVRRSSTVSLPLEAAEAVESLAAGDSFGAAALPGLDEGSSLVVARRLLREGILVLA